MKCNEQYHNPSPASSLRKQTPEEELTEQKFIAWRDLSIILLFSALVFGLTWYFNLLHAPFLWIIQHNVFVFDELYLGLFLLMMGLVWFSFRRLAEIKRNNYHRIKLDQSLVELNQAVGSVTDVIFMTDPNGIFTFVNPAFTTLYGHTAEDIIGKVTPRILKSTQLNEQDYKWFWGTLSSKKELRAEIVNKRKNGELVDIETSVSPILDEHNSITGFMAIQRDITQRKKNEENLFQSEARYRRLFETAKDGIIILDANTGRIEDINPFLADKLGYPFTYFQNKELWEIGLFKDIVANKEAFNKLQQEKYVRYENLSLETKDGRPMWVEFFSNIYEVHGRNVIQCNIRDITERKKSHEALLISEEHFRHSFEYSAAGVCMVGMDHKFQRVNKTFEDITGYGESELQKLTFTDITHPDDKLIGLNQIRQLQDGNIEKISFEKRYLSKNEKIVYCFVSISLMRDDKNIPQFYLVNLIDISKYKIAEESLQSSRLFIEGILSTAPASIFWKDTNLVYLGCNKDFAHDAGFTNQDNIVGKDDYAMVWRDQAESYRAIDRQVIDSGVSRLNVEEIQTTPAGDTICLLTNKVPMRDSSGGIIGILGLYTDITSRQTDRNNLLISEERLRNILENMRDAIFTISPLGFFTTLNTAFEEITGWSVDDWIGKSFTILIHPDDIPLVLDIFTRVLGGETPWLFEARVRIKDGSFISGEFLVSPQKRDGKIIGLLGTGRNITTRKREEENKKSLQSQLLQAQKLESLGTLASGISHDFNNILGIIMGYATLIEKHPTNIPIFKKGIGAIICASQRGASLVKQMLTFARKTDVLFETILLNDSVNEVGILLHETFPKSITYSLHLDNDLPLIKADSTQVHQVLLNLCVNARDAMPNGGTLRITTCRESGEVVCLSFPKAGAAEYLLLKVADSGVGIDEETQRRIFEPFFTTKEKAKGTGLGLSLVYGIMESHGGFVSVQSKLGKGTIFTCYFPVGTKTEEIRQFEVDTNGKIPGGDETILIVEDEEMLREMMTQFLESKGYKVLSAADGNDARTIFNQHQSEIRLVISDLGLPKVSGDELYRTLKLQQPDILFILASGFIEPGEKSKILKSGVKEFIPKPYNPNEVLRAIRRVLDKR